MRLERIRALEHRVGNEDHRDTGFAPEAQHVVVELLPRDFVERGEGLVHQQELGLGDERAGDRDAHLHAARQFARIGLGEIGEADGAQHVHDARACRGLGDAVEPQRQVDIVVDRGPRHQRRFLEHEADIALGLAAPVELGSRASRSRRWRPPRDPR
jgi:hypothetical protein